MTKKPLGWAMATMLLGACAPAPHEPSLLLVHGPRRGRGRNARLALFHRGGPRLFHATQPPNIVKHGLAS